MVHESIERQDISHNSSQKRDDWFERMLNSLQVDYLQLQTDTADEEKKRMYDIMINGKYSEMFSDMRRTSSQFFIEQLIKEYLNELKKRQVTPKQIAFDLSDAKVLVWTEINDSDENSEDGLILAEAKINAKYSKYGFHISSTIVENSDNISVPPHYSIVNTK